MSSVQFSRSLLDALGLKAGDTFSYEILVRLLRAIEARLKPLEDQSGSLEVAIEAVRKVGLDRINEVLVPAIQLVFEIQSKGFLVARSSSSVTLADGNVLTLVVGEEQGRALFTPGPFTALTREANADDYAIARTIDYNQTSGVYTCQVLSFEGTAGPHSDWVIGALAASTIAGMTLRNQALAARDAASGHAGAANTAREAAVAAKGAAEAAAGVAGGHASAANTSRGEALDFRNQAQAAAEAAATFNPANFYTKTATDEALEALGETVAEALTAEGTARGEAITDALAEARRTAIRMTFAQ